MTEKPWLMASLIGLLSLGIGWGIGSQRPTTDGIAARTVGDYLHAVIEADRTFYTQHVVERMEAMLIVTASEKWKEEKTLPLPVQFLREASRGLHVRDAPFRYRLISPWPLNPQNKPASEREGQALKRVVEYGDVVEDEIVVNGKRYFQAIYPDRAVSRACVSCHNAHPEGPKRDFKLNDVMGGLVIQVPLE
ncbi:MAG: Tll0287-like domain-containing protein [Nitrospirales bacterium]